MCCVVAVFVCFGKRNYDVVVHLSGLRDITRLFKNEEGLVPLISFTFLEVSS